MKCPYLTPDKLCKLYDSLQEGYQLQTYCLSTDGNWMKCANYEAAVKSNSPRLSNKA